MKIGRTCLNCHFLIFEGISFDVESFNETYKESLTTSQREKLNENLNIPDRNSPSRILCSKGVWDSKNITDLQKLKHSIFTENRKTCSFWSESADGMELETKQEIEDINENDKQIKKNTRIAVFALVVSLLSAIASIIALFK